uniref:RING-type E3 ubiquitin transferase n=1 Tax=Gossypium raimondii TaxID=29730 RepID=A0A0D2T2X6_GOSRA|nr:hypothetical protein B456_008G091500 [Gossypium raimondii]
MFNLSRSIFLYFLTVVVVTAQSTAPPPRGDSYRLYSHFDPSMAIVVMVLVGAFFFVWILSIYIRHYDESCPIATAAAASSAQRFRPSGLDPEVIENFPVFYIPIEFEDNETLRVIPKCCHVFHLDCIDAWLAYHVTCPVCRAKLTPDSDDIALPVELGSNTTESDNNNTESSHPTRQRVEQQNELVIHVDEETRPREKITGKFTRSHSTGHSMIQPGENTERFMLRFAEEFRKQIAKGEGGGGEGSSRGKSNIDHWVFSRTPPFVSKTGPLKSPKGGGGDWDDGSHSWRGLTSVKEKLCCLNLKVEPGEKGSSPRPSN